MGNTRDAQEIGKQWGYQKIWENEFKICISSGTSTVWKSVGVTVHNIVHNIVSKQAMNRYFKLKSRRGEKP